MLHEPEACEVLVQTDVMVPMRDGCHLATDIYLPAHGGEAAPGRLPVIMERTAYGKREVSRSEIDAGAKRRHTRAEVAAYFVERGYAVVYQDCRGRYDSEGEFVKYLSEAEDGEDTVRWLLRQPWCDGRVGTKGLSYGAHAQMALACQAPPGLAAMVLDSGGFSNAFHGGIRQGGAFELKQVTWAFRRAQELCAGRNDPLAASALAAEDLKAWFKAMPWRPGHSPLSAVPHYEQYLFDQWQHGDFDDYWRQAGLYAEGYYDSIPDIPQVHMSSWYDTYVRTATENYMALSRKKRSAIRLIMGPWLHGDRNVTHSGDVEFGPAAAFDGNIAANWREFRLNWFDRWIKGIPNGVDDEPRVRLFVMGGGSGRKNAQGRLEHGGRWFSSTDWPIPGTHHVNYFLQPDHTLGVEPPRSDREYTFDFDPRDPVPTIGGALTSGAPIFEGGAFDQRESARFFGARDDNLPLSARQDILVFETPPLAEDTVVAGPISVKLHVSSNCPDTDFTAKLIDVHPPSHDYPQGFAMILTDGILRCRYRNSWEHAEPMAEGEVYEIEIEPFATANLFKAGHRIRLDISSSNFPKYDVNPNTGEPQGCSRRTRVAANTVHATRARPSRIVLPIVPAGSLRLLK
jgi:putative CocE/NonD family hydrolase